jgi:hypothetical protein
MFLSFFLGGQGGDTTFSMRTPSTTTLSMMPITIMPLSIAMKNVTLSMMPITIMPLSIAIENVTLSIMTFRIITIGTAILSVVMLSVVILNVAALFNTSDPQSELLRNTMTDLKKARHATIGPLT